MSYRLCLFVIICDYCQLSMVIMIIGNYKMIICDYFIMTC